VDTVKSLDIPASRGLGKLLAELPATADIAEVIPGLCSARKE